MFSIYYCICICPGQKYTDYCTALSRRFTIFCLLREKKRKKTFWLEGIIQAVKSWSIAQWHKILCSCVVYTIVLLNSWFWLVGRSWFLFCNSVHPQHIQHSSFRSSSCTEFKSGWFDRVGNFKWKPCQWQLYIYDIIIDYIYNWHLAWLENCL